MAAAFVKHLPGRVRAGLLACPRAPGAPPPFEVYLGGHPAPDDGSLAAGRRALDMASTLAADERLVVLLSGGASALLAVPAGGVSLADKRDATAGLLMAGADILALNTVRKHLSRIKGGWLGTTARSPTLTLAISDVIGDDLSVIGSGPTVADRTTYGEALAVLDRFGPRGRYPMAVVAWLERGAAGEIPETPKPGSPLLESSVARVIASRADALRGARLAAGALGYHVAVREEAITGEASSSAREHLEMAGALATSLRRPACILSAGETTVRVRGAGRGGRNQEFALAAAPLLHRLGAEVVCASLGTDGIDGPTDAAGGMTDTTTLGRAKSLGIGEHERFLRENDSYTFLHGVGDLVLTGPTGTNVGDIQILLISDSQI
jgi:glycerate-2-kinase